MSYKSLTQDEEAFKKLKHIPIAEWHVTLPCGHVIVFRHNHPKVGEHLTCNKCMAEGIVRKAVRVIANQKPEESNDD